MLQKEVPKDFIICSGKSISLREIVEYVFEKLEIDKSRIITDEKFFRPNDIKNIYGDNERAKKELNWENGKTFFEVLDILIQEELNN